MIAGRARAAIAGSLFVLLGTACTRAPSAGPGEVLLPVFRDARLVAEWPAAETLQREATRTLPAVGMLDQDGRPWTPQQMRGKVVVADFFFTGCTQLCPRLTSALAGVQGVLGAYDDLAILSHSVTPDTDTPALLAAHARRNRIDGRQWRLLSGERAALDRIQAELYLLPPVQADPARRLMHSETVVLLDRNARLRGLYNGTLKLDMEQLLRDARLLLERRTA